MRLVLFTIALVMGAVSATNGQTVNIGGFEFGGCVDSSGDRHAPNFGENIGGTVNVDISTKWGRENCKLIVQRTIEICRQNTGFASNTKNDELAGCLPIFEARSKACVAHFSPRDAEVRPRSPFRNRGPCRRFSGHGPQRGYEAVGLDGRNR